MKKNTILLSIDVFNPNKTLLKYGIYTAKNLSAELVLFDAHYRSVSVVPPGVSASHVPTEIIHDEGQIEVAKRKLAELYKEVSKEWYFTRTKLVTDPIPAWKGQKEYYILDDLEGETPTMILMEIKSDFNLINELLGTPETKVAEEMDCPVMLLPENTTYSEITDINYLLEREKPIEEVVQEIAFLKNIADTFHNKSTINLIYYFGDNKELAAQELAIKRSHILQEVGYDKLVFINMSEHEIENAIHQNTKKYAADIFAFPNRDKTFLERLTNKDNTKRLILQSNIPVLVF